MRLVFTSFYTPDYERPAQLLFASLRRFNLEADIRAVPTFKSWRHAVRSKPRFLLDRREEYPEDVILAWIDADSGIINDPAPVLRDLKGDIGWVYWHPERKDEPLAGLIVIRKTLLAMHFLKEWVRQVEASDYGQRRIIQTTLANVMKSVPVQLHSLPRSFMHRGRVRNNEIVIRAARWSCGEPGGAEVYARLEDKYRAKGGWADDWWWLPIVEEAKRIPWTNMKALRTTRPG